MGGDPLAPDYPSMVANTAEDSVVLALADLLPDPGGEIVIHGTGLGAIGVATSHAVTATGTADAHVTAAGEDVSGFRYYQLDSGITLYCPADTSLLLGPDIG